eukprot:TRINITY_DN1955_c0_g2_i3.p1 TRINITY_DN1955_c0_g2~~TRINITY_DN1955_c0_g2_i3.p1  ORF type:complete len:349 (-),score=81.85 TRINITY_DN1955_c0_g2_i3:82-1128(-)
MGSRSRSRSRGRSGGGDQDVDGLGAAGRNFPMMGAGTGRPFEERPGDWRCGGCGDIQFARNKTCRRCGADKDAVGKDLAVEASQAALLQQQAAALQEQLAKMAELVTAGGASTADYEKMLETYQQASAVSSQASTAAAAASTTQPRFGFRGDGVCNFFSKAGWCKYGDKCIHAHVNGPPVEICQFFSKAGWCKYGNECRHVHIGVALSGDVATPPPKEVCAFFQRAGWCKYEDKCRHVHIAAPPGMAKEVPVNPNVICQHFQRTGSCRYGDRCRYSHGQAGNASGTPTVVKPRGVPTTTFQLSDGTTIEVAESETVGDDPSGAAGAGGAMPSQFFTIVWTWSRASPTW